MELPPLDHIGWGRLLTAVMETDPIAAGAPVERLTQERVDQREQDRRLQRARTVVLDSSTDVYA